MAGIVECECDILAQRDGFTGSHWRQKWEAGCRIIASIERHFGVGDSFPFSLVPLSLGGCVLLLDLGGISQHYPCDLGGGLRTEYAPAKSFPDELRQQARVVEVCVGEQHAIQGVRRDREWGPVPIPVVSFLEKPAVDQESGRAGLETVARPGYVLCSAEEVKLGFHLFDLPGGLSELRLDVAIVSVSRAPAQGNQRRLATPE